MNPSDQRPSDPALSRLYREAGAALPSAAVDAAVLDAARRALAAPAPASWWKRLRVPVTVAATVALGVMLSLTMERQPRELPAAPVAEEQAPAPVETRSALPPLPAAAHAPAAAPAVAARKSAPPPAAQRDAGQEKKAAAAGPREVSPAPFPVASPPAAARLENAAPSGGRADIADTPKVLREAAQRPAPMARAALPAPEAWLEEIRRLRREGRTEEAARALAQFRQAHPGYPLPDDLR